ncbi:MAG: type 4a pilus biogenesis protein PilO [Patescibacteria group bacterium]
MSNIISLSLIIAAAGIFFGYSNPTYRAMTGNTELRDRSVRELKEERGRYIDALNKTKEIEQARTGLLERYNRIPAEDRERIEKLLPDHIDSVRLIIDINNIAAQYGMSLKNINLAQTDPASAVKLSASAIGPTENRFKATQLKFTVAGPYENFRSFVRDLEQSLRLVDIEAVSFNTSAELYNYTITLSTYRLDTDDHARF